MKWLPRLQSFRYCLMITQIVSTELQRNSKHATNTSLPRPVQNSIVVLILEIQVESKAFHRFQVVTPYLPVKDYRSMTYFATLERKSYSFMHIRSNRYKCKYLNFVKGKTYSIGYHQYWLVTESQWNYAPTTTTLLSWREQNSTAILIPKFIYTAIRFLKLNCDFLTFSDTPHPHDSPHTA